MYGKKYILYLTTCCVNCLCLLEFSGGEQWHSKHHFMTVSRSMRHTNFNNAKEQKLILNYNEIPIM